ncbi:hypothetical protein [Tropicimonas sp. IMCC34011]|uniref:hypothetical protein n=1 Tax=Tropicimonas sp. IMCC34011 TaxID=2248759 RepID=UPI000E239442|nr:hypothetical protein [Tropicimonas sp. IMCC34011]
MRAGCPAAVYVELPVTELQGLAVADPPPIHCNQFDRIRVAQSRTEAIPLLTADAQVAAHGGRAERVA